MGAAVAAADPGLDRLQRRFARRGQGCRRQGGEGPARQARRHGGRVAGAESERAGRARLRRADQQRRQAGGVLQLRRNVEGRAQQRSRRRHRLQHLRPGERGGSIAARSDVSAGAGRGQGGLGAHQQDQPLLCAAQSHLRPGHVGAEPGGTAELSLSDLHGVCGAAGKPGVFARQVDDRELRPLQGRRARRCRPRAEAPDPVLGAALSRGRSEGVQGVGRVDRRPRSL